MKYAIIENDPLSLRRIKSACEKLRPQWTLLFTAAGIDESLSCLEKYDDIDLLLCDIELDDGLVFSLFKRIRIECPVIFLTAFEQYTLDAFKMFSIDYLLKPMEITELENAFNKLERIERRGHRMTDEILARLENAVSGSRYMKRLLISINDKFRSVNIDEIGCFVSEDKFVYAIQHDGKASIPSYKSLNDVEGLLDPERFFRVSRDAIATIDSIKKVTRWFKGKLLVELQCGSFKKEIYVSSARRNDFLEWFGS